MPLRLIGVVCGGRAGAGRGLPFGVLSDMNATSPSDAEHPACLSKQQEIVYERLRENYIAIVDGNRRIGDRCLLIVGAGTTLTAAVASGAGGSSWSWGFVSASAIVSLLVFCGASWITRPRDSHLPGAFQIDPLWDDVIDVELDVAYANVIADLISAIGHERDVNIFTARCYLAVVMGVWLQVVFAVIARLV